MNIEGDDPEETALLREMAAEARAYMEEFEWCPAIESVPAPWASVASSLCSFSSSTR